MQLTPKERKKIYEEEKTRIEAREQLEKERGRPSESTVNLSQNIVGVLCYLFGWITGIIFFVLEQKNKWVRFHAAQSIVVFGSLSILTAILAWIPIIGWIFSVVIWIVGFILWVVLMYKAYQGERFKLPLAGDLANAMLGMTINTFQSTPPPSPPPPPPKRSSRKKGKAPPVAMAAAAPPPPTAVGAIEEQPGKTAEYPVYKPRINVALPSLAIFWSIVVLVVFNFFYQYIAYYTYDAVAKSWTWESFFTNDIHIWLPILNTALAIAIVGNVALIIVSNKVIRDSIHVVINAFNLASILTLLVIFPFDFNVIPNSDAAGWTTLGVRVFLIFLAVCFGISLVVRLVKLLVNVAKVETQPY
jgi:uncharacterized membrane protein